MVRFDTCTGVWLAPLSRLTMYSLPAFTYTTTTPWMPLTWPVLLLMLPVL